MSSPIFKVDAFTERPFAGNPAGVCLLERRHSEAWMQGVAAEMNVAETAFLFPTDAGFELRWFTPTAEVALCGHATLASAHVLWEEGVLRQDAEARFETKSGLLTAIRERGSILLDFPSEPAAAAPPPSGLAEALGARFSFCGRNRMDYLVELADDAAVRSVQPAPKSLLAISARGVIVTARSASDEFDFVSRFFAPSVGVDEDPVTGSAHCALAPYWSAKLGRTTLKGYQASRRGGVVKVRLERDRVRLIGKAVTVLRGTLVV